MFSLPALKMIFNFIPETPLARVEADEPGFPSFRYSQWASGNYQDQLEKWFKKRIGFRSFLIKLDNQINFSIFRECYSYNDSIVVGNNNWLLEKGYIKSLNNSSQANLSLLEPRIKVLKQLQDILSDRGIYFLYLISPSKTTIYGEYIPKKYLKKPLFRDTAVYLHTKRLLDRYRVNYLDGHEFFMQKKEIAPYDVFVRGGTHWSRYGAFLFSDNLVARIRQETGMTIGSISCDPLRIDYLPTGTDCDLASLMNVFDMKATFGKTAHPSVTPRFPHDHVQPDVLIVGSSFMHTINEFVFDKLFGERDFFYYYRRNIPKTFREDRQAIPKKEKLRETLLHKQIIIVENNEAQLGHANRVQICIGFNPGVAVTHRNYRGAWVARRERAAQSP